MTIDEVSRRYQIPADVLRTYERWGLGPADGQYGDADLESLSLLLTLQDIGFSPGETEAYMRLRASGADTGAQRLGMLETRRAAALEEIHAREKQLERLDYLRHTLRKSAGKSNSNGKDAQHGRFEQERHF